MDDALLNTLNSIVANATPLIIASIGETKLREETTNVTISNPAD